MIRVCHAGSGICEPVQGSLLDWTLPPDALWIDMVAPTPDEDRAVEKALGLSVPTRDEMAELEASSPRPARCSASSPTAR